MGHNIEAKIFIDGKFIRQSPLIRHKMNYGKHRFHLAAPDGRVKMFQIEIESGKEYVYIWSFGDKSCTKRLEKPNLTPVFTD